MPNTHAVIPAALIDEALAELEAWSRAYPGINDTSALVTRVQAVRDASASETPLTQALADYDATVAAYEDGKDTRDPSDEAEAYEAHEDLLVQHAQQLATSIRSTLAAAAELPSRLNVAHTALRARIGSDADDIFRDLHRSADSIANTL